MGSRKPSLKSEPQAGPAPGPERAGLRLHYFLALCGLGSRRACELLIASGRVAVDGVVIRRQGLRVNPDAQRVTVDSRPVRAEPKVCLLLNKPRDVVCTASDPQGRRTFKALLPAELGARVYTVGRLDRDSEGLLLVTNDGQLAHRLMHPRHQVRKTYLVWTARPLDPGEERQLRVGIRSEGEMLVLDELVRAGDTYRIRLHAGRNRHIRRMFAALGVPIVRLKRIAVGPLQLGSLPSGGWRRLTELEIRGLRENIPDKERL